MMPGVTIESGSKRKSYEQFCPMATALDFVGDRWTILMLRELLGGPARFQDLKNGLPGIATNLLAERLRRMEADGIVRRLEGAGSGSYALTDAGESVRTAIEELGMWGGRMAHLVGRVAPPVHERSIRAIAMAMQSILVRAGDALPAESHMIELDIDGDHVEIVLGPRSTATARPSMRPDARVRSTTQGISAFLLGSPADDTTFEHVSGDPDVTRLLIGALGGAG
jgi:DNA-binding HxlR family transcriptional regulator